MVTGDRREGGTPAEFVCSPRATATSDRGPKLEDSRDMEWRMPPEGLAGLGLVPIWPRTTWREQGAHLACPQPPGFLHMPRGQRCTRGDVLAEGDQSFEEELVTKEVEEVIGDPTRPIPEELVIEEVRQVASKRK